MFCHSLAALTLTLPPVPVSTCPLPTLGLPIPQESPAVALGQRLSVGFATQDRGFRLESFKETAQALAKHLDYELWLDGLPMELRVDPETLIGTPRPRLIAISSWDSKGEALASELGVEAVLVVKSASGKKGKQTKKRYIAAGQFYSGAAGTAATYVGLSYRVNFELHAAVRGAESTEWQEVSSWRIAEDERDAPKSIQLSSAVNGKITLTLSDVVHAQVHAPLAQMARTASFLTIARLGDNIAADYAGWTKSQRTEFWIRAAESSAAALAIPIDTLLQLAFTEWKEDAEPAEKVLASRPTPERAKGPQPPAPYDPAASLARLRRAMRGLDFLFGSPLSRSTQTFIYRWSGAARTYQRSPEGLEAIDELFAAHKDLPLGSRERAETLSFAQVEILRGLKPQRLNAKGWSPAQMILLSDDCELPNLFLDAPSPRFLHGSLLRYSPAQAKAERKTKSKRFKAFSGAQLVVHRSGKYVVADKIPKSKLTERDIYRMVESMHTPRWPHTKD